MFDKFKFLIVSLFVIEGRFILFVWKYLVMKFIF